MRAAVQGSGGAAPCRTARAAAPVRPAAAAIRGARPCGRRAGGPVISTQEGCGRARPASIRADTAEARQLFGVGKAPAARARRFSCRRIARCMLLVARASRRWLFGAKPCRFRSDQKLHLSALDCPNPLVLSKGAYANRRPILRLSAVLVAGIVYVHRCCFLPAVTGSQALEESLVLVRFPPFCDNAPRRCGSCCHCRHWNCECRCQRDCFDCRFHFQSPLFWFAFGLRAAPMAAFPSHARNRSGWQVRHIAAGAAAALARGRGCPGRRSACGCAKSALLCGAGAAGVDFAYSWGQAEGPHAARIGRRGGMADADFMDWPASARFCASQQISLPESYICMEAPSLQQSLDRRPFQKLFSLFDSHHFVTTPHDAAGVAVTAAIGTANAVANAIALIVVFIFSPLFWLEFGLRAAPMAAFPSHARNIRGVQMRHIVAGAAAVLGRGRGCPGAPERLRVRQIRIAPRRRSRRRRLRLCVAPGGGCARAAHQAARCLAGRRDGGCGLHGLARIRPILRRSADLVAGIVQAH